jgi:broad specificity phosphatase PhoE
VLTLHLVRHGETVASSEHRFCGMKDCPLNDRGRRQIESVVDMCAGLKGWQAIYTSPLSRCREMAAAAGRRLAMPVTVDARLREIDHGKWDGKAEADIAREMPEAYREYTLHPGYAAPHGGENGYDVAARALPVVSRIVDAHPAGRVLIVSHKATIRIVACALLGIDIDLYRARLAQPVASFTTFEFSETGPLLRGLGDVSHLPAGLRSSGGV